MRRPRRKLEVNTFPFLAVLLCAMGSFILLLMVIDRRAKIVAQNKANDAYLARKIAYEMDRDERTAAAKAQEAKFKADWLAQKDQIHAGLQAEEEALTQQITQLLAALAKTDDHITGQKTSAATLAQKVSLENAALKALNQELQSRQNQLHQAKQTSQGHFKLREQVTRELLLLEAALRNVQERKARERPVYSLVPYKGKHGSSGKPIYIEVADRAVAVHPGPTVLSPGTWTAETLRRAIEERTGPLEKEVVRPGAPPVEHENSPYLLFLVRPSGIPMYYEALQFLRAYRVDFGYELIEADWVFDFSADKMDQQAWRKPQKLQFEPSQVMRPAPKGIGPRVFGAGGDVPIGGMGAKGSNGFGDPGTPSFAGTAPGGPAVAQSKSGGATGYFGGDGKKGLGSGNFGSSGAVGGDLSGSAGAPGGSGPFGKVGGAGSYQTFSARAGNSVDGATGGSAPGQPGGQPDFRANTPHTGDGGNGPPGIESTRSPGGGIAPRANSADSKLFGNNIAGRGGNGFSPGPGNSASSGGGGGNGAPQQGLPGGVGGQQGTSQSRGGNAFSPGPGNAASLGSGSDYPAQLQGQPGGVGGQQGTSQSGGGNAFSPGSGSTAGAASGSDYSVQPQGRPAGTGSQPSTPQGGNGALGNTGAQNSPGGPSASGAGIPSLTFHLNDDKKDQAAPPRFEGSPPPRDNPLTFRNVPPASESANPVSSANANRGNGPDSGVPLTSGPSGAGASASGAGASASDDGGEPGPRLGVFPILSKEKSRPGARLPALGRITGNRDFVMTVECFEQKATLTPPGRTFDLSDQNAVEQLAALMKSLVNGRQGTVRVGEPPYRPIVHFRVQPDGRRTYYSVYPRIAELGFPMSRETPD